ncbi:hypothetical protein DWV48_06120 [Collinsella sp. AF08-23]|nr:hypothetical protein DWV48_06120 [Collinsella sp. AF08-23]
MVLRGVDSPGAGLGRARGALPGIRGHRRGARAAHHRRRARRQPDRKEGGLDVGLEYGCDSRRLHQLSGHYRTTSYCTSTVQAVSRKPVWWRGECGHVYQMAVRDRVRAKPGYCPYCSGRKRPERPIRLD